jgi:hypothetical protein
VAVGGKRENKWNFALQIYQSSHPCSILVDVNFGLTVFGGASGDVREMLETRQNVPDYAYT